jgi:two-component system sensor histidine kinase KdpD
MAGQRINPEILLERAKEEERQDTRGKLKIYLGAAPGVGKTYAMLKDAAAKRKQGLDVLIGLVESHSRKDIEDLLEGLEILPRQIIEYRGRKLEDFDLDAALKRNPGLILMDEMAHTNVEGLRHAKRWQDIKELLDRGIDVYTTLNVQHIESLSDDISQIIHAPIKETVPDLMLEMADTIELIDLPPEDLLKRLQEGKVYFPEQAELAKEGFFRKGNLIALRELALRVTAERVGAQVLLYRQGLGIKHIWSTREKILVCVGTETEDLQLVRAARRLATSLQAEWVAVHVDSSKINLTEQQRNNAVKNLQIASRLGAETAILTGYDLVKEIMSYAREQNITLIMVWKHIRPRWKDLFSFRLADELVRNSREIDVYIMTGNEDPVERPQINRSSSSMLLRIYLITLGIVALCTIMNLALYRFVDRSSLIVIYLVGVTVVALFGKVGPSFFASILSVIVYGVFFLSNSYKLSAIDLGYLGTLAVMILLTQIISHLTIQTRWQAIAARSAERRAAALHKLSRKLASTRGVDKLLNIGVHYVADVFDSEVMALLPENQILKIRTSSSGEELLNVKEQSVAQWVYDLGQIAGLGTDTLPFSEAMYIPLLASQGTMGVLRIHPKHPDILFTPEQMNFLETCANQIALTIEVDRLQEKKKQSELEKEIDHARNVLLQSVSQDLRAPLASIMLSASTQMQLSNELNSEHIKKLGQNVYNESEQLSRLINNLLQITYLESDSIKLEKQFSSLKDLVGRVLTTSREKIGKTPVYINIPAVIPNIPFDPTLLEAVLLNLIDNAVKFAPGDKPIEIYATINKDMVIVSIEDSGPGISADEVHKLFEKFYRGRLLTTERGLGLGLAICRIIIEAHGGKIWAENRDQGGAAFRFSLPLGKEA